MWIVTGTLNRAAWWKCQPRGTDGFNEIVGLDLPLNRGIRVKDAYQSPTLPSL